MRPWLSILALLVLASAGRDARAGISTLITYQGVLRDSTGAPISGAVDLSFAIYPDSATGTALWNEPHTGTPVATGLFNVLLGSATPFPPALFTGSTLWLQTSIGGVPLLPRSLMGSTPYAFRALVADSVVGGTAGPWSVSGGNVYRASGNVGVGTNAPGVPLDVNGTIKSRSGGYVFPDGTSLSSANLANGVTLDQAYRKGGAGVGRTITADGGAVNVAGSGGLTVNGNVGIGTTSPGSKLTVTGLIESTSGGIKFPDGTTQTSAARPRTFVVCVNFSGTACTTINCSCGTATRTTFVQSDCTVSSETGSCSALSFSCMGGGIGHGTCCVCTP